MKLIIEVDGGIHTIPENHEYDENRTAELEKFDLTVIRFTNFEIENNMNRVLQTLICATSPPLRACPAKGGRDLGGLNNRFTSLWLADRLASFAVNNSSRKGYKVPISIGIA